MLEVKVKSEYEIRGLEYDDIQIIHSALTNDINDDDTGTGERADRTLTLRNTLRGFL